LLNSRLDLAWFTMSGLIALFVVLRTDRTIRILSYGRARISDVAPWQVKLLRICAVLVLIGSVVQVAKDLGGIP
jgi:hypothetical protein